MKFWVVIFLVLYVASCAGTNKVPDKPAFSKCPPVGTEVPFSKLINNAFAEDYVGCNITTSAQFVASGSSNMWMPPLSIEGMVVFRALPPGAIGATGPLGVSEAYHIVIPKEKGEITFELKPGDLVSLTGGTYVKAYGSTTTDDTIKRVVFVAKTMEHYKEHSEKIDESPKQISDKPQEITNEEIRIFMTKKRPTVMVCLAKYYAKGDVTVGIIASEKGNVTNVTIEEELPKMANTCIIEYLKKLKLPESTKPYDFKFKYSK